MEPTRPTPKFFGKNGIELHAAARGIRELSEFQIPPGALFLTGVETCAADDPDVAFHVTGSAWADFNARLTAFNAAHEAVMEFAVIVPPKLGELLAELSKIIFWPEHGKGWGA